MSKELEELMHHIVGRHSREAPNLEKEDAAPRDLHMWVIYENPIDVIGFYVVREHIVTPTGSRPRIEFSKHDTLEAARASLPPGLHNLGRDPDDERQIVESWA